MTSIVCMTERPAILAAPPAGRGGIERLLAIAEEHRQSGALDAAAAAYETVLDAEPMNPGALVCLAELLLRRGSAIRAQLLLLRCCGVAPELAVAWSLLGRALRASGDAAAACTAFAEAQRLEPTNYSHALGRIVAAQEAGKADEELMRLEAASDADPLDVVLLAARGALLERLGRFDEAADALEAAAMLAPDEDFVVLELANALTRGDRSVAAEAALARAIEILPDEPLLRGNHAVVLMRLHRYREAANELQDLIETHGPTAQTLSNLSTALTALGEQDQAVAAARAACGLAPDMHLPWRSVVNAMAYRDGVSAAEMLETGRRAARALSLVELSPLSRDADPDRRLRVGLLSQMLKSHPVGWLTIAGFENLDPAAFEIVCIGQAATGDPIERRFRAIAAAWHEADILKRQGLAASIRALDLDILIDLSGYGDRGMMWVCGNRVAPLQIKWVGMQNHSSGLPRMDYFVTDRWETPAELSHLYSERLMRMPDGYVVYSPPPYAPDVRPPPASRSGAVTFGCFNNIAKVTPRVIEVWADILHRVPRSRLLLKTPQLNDAETQARVWSLFAACGIDRARLELRGKSAHREFLRQYGDVDIVLDPFPYVGGLSTCEALWMGVPTITLAGETFSSRHSASHMSNVGLEDWVAHDIDAYRDMAVRRAADIGALTELRAQMRARVKASPLCDGPRFGRNLGMALRGAWQAWCVRAQGAHSDGPNNGP